MTSNRNFLRQGGAAVGLAVSSAILANVLKASFPKRLEALAGNSFAAPNLSHYSVQDQTAIREAYALASRAVFIFCSPLVGVCFLLSAFIKDHGLVRKEETEGQAKEGDGEPSPQRLTADEEKMHPVDLDEEGQDCSKTAVRVSLENADGNSKAPSISSEKSAGSKIHDK